MDGTQRGLNADLLIRLLKQLIKHRKRKIIIVDNLRVHHAKLQRVARRAQSIEVFYLARNSILKYLNNDLKQTIASDGGYHSR